MAWITEHLKPETAPLVQLQEMHPYATALLLAPDTAAPRVHRRIRNFNLARAEEQVQPIRCSSAPYHIVLDPCNMCNLACPLCVQSTDPTGRRRRIVPPTAFERLIDEVSDHVVRLDLFNWGEPLLHPEFANLVKRAATVGIYTRTSSHFSHRHSVDAYALIDAGLRYLVVSIDGAQQDTYAQYRVGGTLEIVLENLERISDAKRQRRSVWPIVEWQYLVMAHNENEVDEARRLARSFDVDVFRYGGARGQMSTKVLESTPDNVARSHPYLLPPDHALSEYTEDGQKRRQSEQERCWWLWGKVTLHPDGGVSPCWSGWFDHHDVGNWITDGLDTVWRGASYTAARTAATTGGCAAGTTMCESCAFHQSFVPTPDGDGEVVLSERLLCQVADALSEAGVPVARSVREAVTAAFSLDENDSSARM
jgi:MoaA/NifB/PqqE/SkfB family radical SAM enzyme